MKDLFSRLFTRPVREPEPPSIATEPAEPSPPDRGSPGVRGLLGSVDGLMFVLDEKSRFAALSPPLLQLLGLHEHEAVGRVVGDLFQGSPGWLDGASRAAVRFQSDAGVCWGAICTISPIPAAGDQAEFRLAQLSGVGVDPSNDAALGPAPATSARDCRPEDFAAALEARLDVRPDGRDGAVLRLTAGRIEVIGLRDVKAALGARWPAVAAKARAVARAVVARRLAAEDVFSEIPDDRWLICFASLSVEEAHQKAELIAREIRDRLLRVTDSPVTVETQVERITLQASEVSEGQTRVSGILRMLDEAREERRRADEARLADVLRRASLRLLPILGRSLGRTGVMLARLDDTCPVDIADLACVDDGAKVAAELDTLLLGLTAREIVATPAGRTLAVAVPVTWSTLHERRLAEDYLALCRSLAPTVRSRLLFEVHGLTDDVPDLRLQDLLSRLAPFSAHRLLRVATLDHRFSDLNRFRVAMVTIEARHAAAAAPRTERKFPSLVSMVRGGGSLVGPGHGGGSRLLVQGVRDLEDARWYLAHGADFVALQDAGGVAAEEPVAIPRATERGGGTSAR